MYNKFFNKADLQMVNYYVFNILKINKIIDSFLYENKLRTNNLILLPCTVHQTKGSPIFT